MTTTKTTVGDVAEDYKVSPLAVNSYCDNYGVSAEDIDKDHFFDSYVGWYPDGLESYAEELVTSTVSDCEWLIDHGYIAYDRIARDLEYEGYWNDYGHVFRPA